MIEVAPFKAYRLNDRDKKYDLSKFICPPYDVISEEEQKALLALSPYNIVRLELPVGSGDQKYVQVAATLRKWVDGDVIQRDRKASFYLLETEFHTHDPFAAASKLKRYGVLVALRMQTPGKGFIRPHEKTLSKAKEDRLNLLNTVHTDMSPIFGLFFDKKKEWRKWVASVTKTKPMVHATQKPDMRHHLWKIDHPGFQKRLRSMVKSKDLFIADGHHRYEVAWAYKEIRFKNEPEADLKQGWHFVMTYICPMEEPGLLMLPTHRLVKSDRTWSAWIRYLDSCFEHEDLPNKKTLLDRLIKSDPTDRILGWITTKGFHLLKLKKAMSIDRCLAYRPPALRSLDVVLLHDLILEEPRGVQYEKDKTIFFTQDIDWMIQKTKEDSTWVGFVLRPVDVNALAQVALAGEVMPPKTTYFYPKVPTGVTLMPLDQEIL